MRRLSASPKTPSKFSDLPIHPALLQAIAGKGYETATPVQAAVVEASLRDRDLLVSAPTGSGKTLAFGTLIAERLLAEQPVAEPGEGAPSPRRERTTRALVVAPTRELAAQVARELSWLFAGSKLRTAAFTGGTAITGDLKQLRTGVDIVVGTPGRLADLHRRAALSLAAVEVLVLDEADEMLDLGVRSEEHTSVLQ